MKNNEKNNRNIIAYALGRGFFFAAFALLFLNCSNVDIPSTPQDIAVSSSSEDSVSSSSEEEELSSSSEAEPSSSSIEPLPIWDGSADTTWYTDSSGKSTFIITTAEQLAGVNKLLNGVSGANGNRRTNMSGKTINLGNDIMLNDTTGWGNWKNSPPSKTWTSIDYTGSNGTNGDNFGGTFDGNGHVINGVYGNSLFGSVFKANIKNLGVNASYINKVSSWQGCYGGLMQSLNGQSPSVGSISNSYFVGTVNVTGSGASTVGGLVGCLQSGSEITESYSIGAVTSGTATSDVGGLVGKQNGGTIIRSYSTSTVTSSGTGTGTSTRNVGGLVGNQNGGRIENSYSIPVLIAGDATNVGGLVGNIDLPSSSSTSTSTITDSYSVSTLVGSPPTNCGGLVGNKSGAGTEIVTKSYYDTKINSSCNNSYGEGKSTEEMKIEAAFVDWNFYNMWKIDATKNSNYPYLIDNPPRD